MRQAIFFSSTILDTGLASSVFYLRNRVAGSGNEGFVQSVDQSDKISILKRYFDVLLLF